MAANGSDWAGFVLAIGGSNGENTEIPASLAVEWNGKPGHNGEAIDYELLGVECGSSTGTFISKSSFT